eukprot:4711766-Alexandrium_andersonii.AAC.1
MSGVFSPDSSQILTASDDRTARLWSADSGNCLLTLPGHGGEVCSAAFSPDASQLLTASRDNTAKP